MKIRVVMCLNSEKHISRILEYYENHYDKIERFDIHMFSDYDLAREYVETHKLDIFLLDETYKNSEFIQGNYLCAYLVDENSVATLNGMKAIGKYQKAESFFGELFGYFADSVEDRQYKFTSDNAQMSLFQNASGGSGCTTVAIAYACALAEQRKKVLYLNLEHVSDQDNLFYSEGDNDFGEVIYAVKSGSGNCVVKILACVTQDKSGVYFIKSCRNILNMEEITEQDMENLLVTLKESCDFEYIVVDKDFGLSARDLAVMKQADAVTFVLEANDISQKKFIRITDAIKILDDQFQTDMIDQIAVIFNKYHERQRIILDPKWKVMGGFPEYENKNMQQIVHCLSKMKILRNL